MALHLRHLRVDLWVYFSEELELRLVEDDGGLLLALFLVFLVFGLFLLLLLLSRIIDMENKYITFQLLSGILLQSFYQQVEVSIISSRYDFEFHACLRRALLNHDRIFLF